MRGNTYENLVLDKTYFFIRIIASGALTTLTKEAASTFGGKVFER